MKYLLYLGSVHSGELPEFFGLTDDHVGTDALGMYSFPRFSSAISAADEDYTSKFHQP